MDMDITPRQARDAIPLPQIPPSLPRRQSLPSDGSSGSLSSSGSNNGNSKGSSASTSYGSQDDDDDDGDDDDDEGPNGPIYPPLEFTCALDHIQPACKDILLSFTGGCKPYSLSAFWFHQSNQSDTTWVKLKEQTWDNTFQWNILAPVSSSLLFTLTDAKGSTITSEDAINVQSNERGYAADMWCQYVYASKPVPAAATNSNNRYAWNGTNNNAAGGPSSVPSTISFKTSSTSTSSSEFVDATDLSDRSTTIAKAIHDADAAKVIEGVLAAMLCTSLIALGALLFLFLRLRRRLREARQELNARHQQQLEGVMSEKPGEGQSRYSPNNNDNGNAGGGLATPRAGLLGRGRNLNPFDNPALNSNANANRSPFLGSIAGTPNERAAAIERNRQSTTSLISAVPSNGARSTAADSTLSTEFYHTYKASTIPNHQLFDAIERARFEAENPNMSSRQLAPTSSTVGGSTSTGGRKFRGLFAPMSFFSSATPSPATSASSRMRANNHASGTGVVSRMTSDRSTINSDDYYNNDRSSSVSPNSSRPDELLRNTSTETVQVPITRVSTRSDTSSAPSAATTSSSSSAGENSNALPSSRLAPLSTPSISIRSSGRSSGNGADESSIQGDVYDDSDAASFSNFSFVDTGSSSSYDAHTRQRLADDEQSIDDDTNPFADRHANESSEDDDDGDEQSTVIGTMRSNFFFNNSSSKVGSGSGSGSNTSPTSISVGGSGSAVSAPRGRASMTNTPSMNGTGTGEYKRKSWTRAPTDYYNSRQQAGDSSIGLTATSAATTRDTDNDPFSNMMARSNSSLFDDAESEVDLSSTPRYISR